MRHKLVTICLTLTSVILIAGCSRYFAEEPNESGEIEIVMSDYTFEPSTIRLQAGQEVTIVLRNDGNKMHEFMAGRDVHLEGNFTEGFSEDFFEGISLEISGPGMVMGLPGMDMEGMDMGDEMDMTDDEMNDDMDMDDEMDMTDDHEDDEHETDMDDGMDMDDNEMSDEMDMTDDHEDDEHETDMDDGMDMDDDEMSNDMDMDGERQEDEHQEDEHDEDMSAGEFGPLQLPSMDAHSGVMIMLDPVVVTADDVTTITFTIPEDKVGTWEFGCFQERGQHYDDGMRGKLIVE